LKKQKNQHLRWVYKGDHCMNHDRMSAHKKLQRDILALQSQIPHVRLFPNDVKYAWVGNKVCDKPKGFITLSGAHPFKTGLTEGASDLIGWTTIYLAPFGNKAIITAIEIKTGKGKLTQQQKRFLEKVKDVGGFAGVARCTQDVFDIIQGNGKIK